jgi:hypothetical protein
MDTTNVLPVVPVVIGGIIILAIIGLIAYMLHRSWGDSLPAHIQPPQHNDTSSYNATAHQNRNQSPFADDADDTEATAADDEAFNGGDAAHESSPPLEGLILIVHPLLRDIFERAHKAGGRAARYIVRDGDDLYIALDQIKDPVERHQVTRMIEHIQIQGHGDAWDIISLMTHFGHGQTSHQK